MNDADIWNAFSLAVEAFANSQSPAVPLIAQGVGGEPPSEGLWIETKFFPNKSENYGLAARGPTILKGFCQVSIGCRPGVGVMDSYEMADLVSASFKKGTVLGPARVEVEPWNSSPLEEPDRVYVAITIRYRASVTRDD